MEDSPEVPLLPPLGVIPEEMLNVVVQGGGPTSITFGWNVVHPQVQTVRLLVGKEPRHEGEKLLYYEMQIVDYAQTPHGPAMPLSVVSPFTVVNLEPGSTYRFRLHALDVHGGITVGPESVFHTPPSPPGVPIAVEARQRAKRFIRLRWKAPLKDFGAKVEKYVIQINHSLGMNPPRLENVERDGEEIKMKGLEPGKPYGFCVAAVNEAGCGRFSQPVILSTLPAAPSAPVSIQCVRVTENEAELIWAPPENLYGAPITEYRVECDGAKGEYWPVYTGSSPTCVIPQLSSGCMYCVRVRASTTAGNSPWSDVFSFQAQITPPEAPFPPRALGVSKDSIQLQWVEPRSPSAPVEGYVVERETKGGWTLVYEGKEKNCVMDELHPGQSVNVRVVAINKAGKSAPSAILRCRSEGAPPSEPLSCRNILEEESPGRMTIEWEPPLTDNGEPVQGYRVAITESEEGEWNVVEEHIEETTYTLVHRVGEWVWVRIQAVNSKGRGPPSTPVRFQVGKDVPGMVEDVHCSHRKRDRLHIAWSPPKQNGGTPIIHYSVRLLLDSTREQVSMWEGPECACVIQALQPDTTYLCSVAAENACGLGPRVMDVVMTTTPSGKLDAPSPPYLVESTPTSLRIAWDRVLRDEAEYVVEWWNKREWCVLEHTKAMHVLVQDLAPATEYAFRLQCRVGIGCSPYSSVLRLPTEIPPPPTPILPPRVVEVKDTAFTLEWDGMDESAHVQEYVLEMQQAGEKKWTEVHHAQALQAHVTRLIPQTEYLCRLCFRNSVGTSKPSPEIHLYTNTERVPEMGAVLLHNAMSHSLEIGWQAPVGSSRRRSKVKRTWTYEVEMETQDRTCSLVYQGAKRNCVVEDLMPSTTYLFRARALSSNGVFTIFGPDVELSTDAPVAVVERRMERVQKKATGKKGRDERASLSTIKWKKPKRRKWWTTKTMLVIACVVVVVCYVGLYIVEQG